MPHIHWRDAGFGKLEIVSKEEYMRRLANNFNIFEPPITEEDTQPADPLFDLVDVTDWQRNTQVIRDHDERYALLRERMEARRAAYKPSLLSRVIAALWRWVDRT